eukprot:Hpha_TRINITY_DN404_c0_g1::TRINITY_DN404_c0_g1_i1::g.27580::m.27580
MQGERGGRRDTLPLPTSMPTSAGQDGLVLVPVAQLHQGLPTILSTVIPENLAYAAPPPGPGMVWHSPQQQPPAQPMLKPLAERLEEGREARNTLERAEEGRERHELLNKLRDTEEAEMRAEEQNAMLRAELERVRASIPQHRPSLPSAGRSSLPI